MDVYKVSTGPGRSRAAAWTELYAARLERADLIQPDGDRFEAELAVADVGPLRVARLSCDPCRIDRTADHIGYAGSRTYSLILLARGRAVFAHYGHQESLGEGDFILCDSAAPHAVAFEAQSEVVMLRVPAVMMKEHLPSPEYFCGRRLPAREGMTDMVAAATRMLSDRLESVRSPAFQERIARHLLDMIATSYAVAFDSHITCSSNVSGRHAKVKLHIEQHLRDPELSPCLIAEKLKLSPRYLRMIFASSSETVSAYILRRRLEECARQMADPRWSGHSITQIAFSWGFNSAPHFTRSFRERFSVSPRQYRQQLPADRLGGLAGRSRSDPSRSTLSVAAA